jgi:hypothetical protein
LTVWAPDLSLDANAPREASMARETSERFPPGPSPFFPADATKVLGLFGPGNIESDEDWYERVHAPDFWAFAPPYMTRYARNWVRSVEAGAAPAFVVMTEIQFRDEAAKRRLREVMNGPAAAHLFQHMAERSVVMGERFRPAGSALLPVRTQIIGRTGEGAGPRKLLLLRRARDAEAFEQAVLDLAAHIARDAPAAAVTVDLCRESAPILSADAVVYVETADDLPHPTWDDPALEFVSLLNVETRSSDGRVR